MKPRPFIKRAGRVVLLFDLQIEPIRAVCSRPARKRGEHAARMATPAAPAKSSA